MKHPRSYGFLSGAPLTLLWAAVLGAAGHAAESTEAESNGGRRALLIGCTRYVNLDERLQLRGAVNDIRLMRELLVGRFGFPRESIAILSEAEAESNRPTRANIEREFRRLAQVAKRGDQLVVLLGGHGSLQPAVGPASGESGPGCVHKTFLPADAGPWDGDKSVVANAILDDEFHAWIAAIRKTGARLWIIVDSCHCGGMIRGAHREIPRRVPAEVLVPADVLNRAMNRPATRGGSAPRLAEDDAGLAPSFLGPGVVTISAAQGNETTYEVIRPPDSQDAKYHGLFTYTIVEVLTQSTAPITYRELIQQVHARYVQRGRDSPTPLVQGPDLDQEVLGVKTWPGRSRILLEDRGKEFVINAGFLHGLTRHSVLAVQPPPGQPRRAQPLGFVRISDCRTFDATVRPCDAEGKPIEKHALPAEGVCELVSVDHGELRLRLAVDVTDNAGLPVPQVQLQRVIAEVRGLFDQAASLIRVVDDPADADWLVRLDAGRVYIVPATGVPELKQHGRLPSQFGPAPAGEPLPAWLSRRLNQIAQAENLKRLAGTEQLTPGGGRPLDVHVQPMLVKNKGDREGCPLPVEKGIHALYDGDRISLKLSNPNRYPLDVTLLYLDCDFGITPIFPRRNELNRLDPGESRTLWLRVTTTTTGLEHLVVIAVRGAGAEPRDFSVLAQQPLDQTGGDGSRGLSSTLDSPLERLLARALRAHATPRSASASWDPARAHIIRLLSWQVSAAPRPPSTPRP